MSTPHFRNRHILTTSPYDHRHDLTRLKNVVKCFKDGELWWPLQYSWWRNNSSKFSSNSISLNASELLENHKEMFPYYFIHNDCESIKTLYFET